MVNEILIGWNLVIIYFYHYRTNEREIENRFFSSFDVFNVFSFFFYISWKSKTHRISYENTYRFLKRLFAVQIYRSTSDCSQTFLISRPEHGCRYAVSTMRQSRVLYSGITATYPAFFDCRLRYSTENASKIFRAEEHLAGREDKNISRRLTNRLE